jgi:phosphatidylserine decarboxylase
MNMKTLVRRLGQREDLNFALTNRIPRRALTSFVGRVSRSERPWIRGPSIALWRVFTDLDLEEAETKDFRSLRGLFTRRLKPGARPVCAEPGILVSPCDAIVGAHGPIDGGTVLQAKGSPYSLRELLGDLALASTYTNGTYATLRLTSGMYHRFHAPHDCRVEQVRYIEGDTWNVNPAALQRVRKVFCKNERAVLRTRLSRGDHIVTLVPVGAILVASIRLHFLDVVQHLRRQPRPAAVACEVDLDKGDEMGWFENGSTIILIAPSGFELCPTISQGHRIRMGEALMRLPASPLRQLPEVNTKPLAQSASGK